MQILSQRHERQLISTKGRANAVERKVFILSVSSGIDGRREALYQGLQNKVIVTSFFVYLYLTGGKKSANIKRSLGDLFH